MAFYVLCCRRAIARFSGRGRISHPGKVWAALGEPSSQRTAGRWIPSPHPPVLTRSPAAEAVAKAAGENCWMNSELLESASTFFSLPSCIFGRLEAKPKPKTKPSAILSSSLHPPHPHYIPVLTTSSLGGIGIANNKRETHLVHFKNVHCGRYQSALLLHVLETNVNLRGKTAARKVIFASSAQPLLAIA